MSDELMKRFAAIGKEMDKPVEAPVEEAKIVVPADFRLRLSPSKMIVFKDCKRNFQRALLEGQDGGSNIHSVSGTTAHAIVERINKGEVLTPEERADAMHQTLMSECIKNKVDVEFTKGYKTSRDNILTYAPPEGKILLSAEKKHVLSFPDYDFSYIVDAEWTDEEGEWLDIEDYKTSAATPGPFQVQLYGWAEWKRIGHNPDRMRGYYNMLRHGMRHEVPINMEIVQQIDEYMHIATRQILAMLAKGDTFPATPGNCFFCQVPNCAVRK